MGNTLISKSETEKSGFQVISVKALSPAADCGLKANVDFIIKLNGDSVLNKPPDYIIDIVKKSIYKAVDLEVYNTNSCSIRHVSLIPSDKWPGQGLLGLEMRVGRYKVTPAADRTDRTSNL